MCDDHMLPPNLAPPDCCPKGPHIGCGRLAVTAIHPLAVIPKHAFIRPCAPAVRHLLNPTPCLLVGPLRDRSALHVLSLCLTRALTPLSSSPALRSCTSTSGMPSRPRPNTVNQGVKMRSPAQQVNVGQGSNQQPRTLWVAVLHSWLPWMG